MDIGTVADLIASLGFPMFVAIFMLVKNDKQMSDMKDALNQLTNAIDKLYNQGGDDH